MSTPRKPHASLPRIALALFVTCLIGNATLTAAETDTQLAPVSASSIHSAAYPPEYAIDGKLDTRWASREMREAAEWLRIDFGRSISVDGVTIHWETAHATDYQIQVSDDDKTWQTLHHQPASKGGKESFAGLSGKGRFLRIHCLKMSSPWNLASIWEIEILDPEATQALAEAQQRAEKERLRAEVESRRALADVFAKHDVEEILFAVREPGKDGHWYANFSYYAESDKKTLYGAGGSLRKLNVKTGEVTRLLDDPEGGVRDPVLDYDARTILFSYRPGGTEHYHLYRMNIDGSGLTQLTSGEYDDIEPIFLPDGDLLFVSSRCKRWVNCWLSQVAVLHRCRPDGSDIRPISANLEHDNTPWVLPDGRILYQRWEYVDRSQVDYHHLWTTNPDGTGQMIYYGNMHPGLLMIDAKPIPGTNRVASIFSPGHGRREHEGTLTVVDTRKGPDDRSFARAISQKPDCRDPWALSPKAFMVARGTRIDLMNELGQTHLLYQLPAEDVQAGRQCHEPRPILPRKRERIIAPRTELAKKTGRLVLTDIYNGRNMSGLERGEIKKLLVLESLPKPINFTGGMDPLTYGGSFTLERVVGTVPVEPDGSAYLELPALRSLFFVALDKDDLAVKRMQSFLTVQPGEVTGCVGCHEQRTQAFNPSVKLMATNRPPSRITPVDDCPDVFDFPRDIQPILDRLCVDCHATEKTPRGGPFAGKVLLTGDHGPMFSHAYFTMTVKRLFVDGRDVAKSNYPPRSLGSGASRILTMLDGSHFDVKATEHDKRMLRLWIEVGAPYPGTYAALGCGSVGGYYSNQLVNTDFNWPTTTAGAEVISRRCASCHVKNDVLPKSLCDERGISFWRFSVDDPRLKLSRHIVFNLGRPERSLLLLAPLSERAGGLELCRDATGEPVEVFANPEDADYQTLLAMIDAGRENLERIKRFDMPDFRPRPEYVREMRRYGILPPDQPADVPINVYTTDRAYWQSLWHGE